MNQCSEYGQSMLMTMVSTCIITHVWVTSERTTMDIIIGQTLNLLFYTLNLKLKSMKKTIRSIKVKITKGLRELEKFNNHLRDVEPQKEVQYHDINGGFHIGHIPQT